MTNPADGAGMQLLRGLSERIAELEAAVARLTGQRLVSFELARVVVYSGGSMCTVRYPDYLAGEMPWSSSLSGPTRVLPFQYGYTPVATPGSQHNVLIINTPAWSGVIMPITAF